ncbi:MAG: hypothetical protein OHK0046_44640 [Anaerolineae bacterium]
MSEPMTVDDVLKQIDTHWTALESYLQTLTPAQMTEPKDAAGWTVKDHLMHLALWEKGVLELLKGHSRLAAMGIDKAVWDTHDVDVVNAAIQQNTRDLPLDEVQRTFESVHTEMVKQISQMSDADLQRPYQDFDPAVDSQNPIIRWIAGDTFEHYEEHLPWIKAIVEA